MQILLSFHKIWNAVIYITNLVDEIHIVICRIGEFKIDIFWLIKIPLQGMGPILLPFFLADAHHITWSNKGVLL